MNDRLLSVVITIYNEEKYISKCIESVINQTYTNLDVVIVDDGSSDNSPKICDSYSTRDQRIRVFHKKNGGSVSSRKIGVQEAKGEYITYIDGDDWIELDHYEKIMSQIEDADIIAFGLTCVYSGDEKEVIVNDYKSGVFEDETLDDLKCHSLYSGNFGKFGIFPSMCAKVFRTSLIKENMLAVKNNIRMGDDGACTFPAVCDAKKIIINNDITGYMYRKTVNNSITTLYDFKEFSRIENLYHVLKKAFEDRNAIYMYEQMAYYFAFLFRIQIVCELANPNLRNILVKINDIRIVREMDWIQFLRNNIDNISVNKELSGLIRNINNIPRMFWFWFVLRKIIKYD